MTEKSNGIPRRPLPIPTPGDALSARTMRRAERGWDAFVRR
ncbi:hypothetical protein ACIRSU_34080 [Streptomyces sp. NPDC101160]